jgi:hypothetical protein
MSCESGRWFGARITGGCNKCPYRDAVIGIDDQVAIIDGRTTNLPHRPQEVVDKLIKDLLPQSSDHCGACKAVITNAEPISPVDHDPRPGQFNLDLEVIDMGHFLDERVYA